MTSVWTEAAVADLKYFWSTEKLSATLIAIELSKHHPGHFTRCMVIGKKRRLKLERASSPNIELPPPQPQPQPQPVVVKEKPTIDNFTLFDLTSCTCRWPTAVPPAVDFTRFCGRFTRELYCLEHTAIAYNKSGR